MARPTLRLPHRRPSAVSAVLVALAYVITVLQRPGETIADTKLALYVAPHRFLRQVLDVWSPTSDLGHVWGGQYNGYAFPMAPWFALGDTLGLPVWLVHRLWLGTLLAVAAVGMVVLLRALVAPGSGVLHLVGGLLYVACPYVVVLMDRTSISLLAYAALPWMLLVVHRGLHDPRAWRWPAAGALLLACTGGGINAAVTGWVLVAPLLLVLFELGWGGVDRRALVRWLVRLGPCAALANAWWVVPLAVHARYGVDFLPFTEQPGTIWSTTSLTESLRGMGFWTSYIGVGFGGTLRPYAGHGAVLLTDLKVVLAGLLVPGLVLLGLAWTRRARYAPYFLTLVLAGLLVMGAGWPEGTPLRHAATFTYNHVAGVRVLRTTYKAGPLVTLGLAALGGMAAAEGWARLGAWGPRAPRRLAGLAGRLRVPRRGRSCLPAGPTPWQGAAAVAGVVLVALSAWPLARGTAPDEGLHIRVPDRWRALARTLDARPDDRRALVLPGQLFSSYTWGQTIDAVLPSLTDHPVATRNIVPFADRRSVELQWAVDDLVSQERVLPGQLPSLLDLLGVGDVVVAADGDRSRSGELGPLETAATLAGERGLRGGRAFGGTVVAKPAAGRLGSGRRVPVLRDVRVPTAGLVRVLPRTPQTLFDGGARALTSLAAFGELDPQRPYRAGADVTTATTRALAAAGGDVVVADGVRRQAFVASRLRGGAGQVLPVDRRVSEDGTLLDPYADTTAGTDAQTVQVLAGIAGVSAPFSPQVTQFPEHRPFAALDGDVGTSWLADRYLAPDRAVLTVGLGRRVDVPRLALYPASDERALVTAVRVNGRRFAVRRGWNTLAVGLKGVSRIAVAIAAVRRPLHASAGAGGIRELRIPGVRASESLRVPDLLEGRLRTADLSSSTLTYLLERFTAAGPEHHARLAGPEQAGLLSDARDPEQQLDRVIAPPVARRYAVDAWTRAGVGAPDHVLDRVAGVRGALVADSSSRMEGLPRYRASGAFDGAAGPHGRAWIGQWIPGRGAWIAWREPRPLALQRLRIVPVTSVRVRRPTRVRLVVDGHGGPAVAVAPDGLVELPVRVTGRRFRLDVLRARFPAGTPARDRARRAVGIAELRAARLGLLHVPRRGRVALPCGSAALRVSPWAAGPSAGAPKPAVRLALRADVDLRALDAGREVRAEGCGQLELPSAEIRIQGAGGALVVDRLRLKAAPPAGLSVVPGPSGRVVDAGHADGSGRSGLRVRVTGPSWLVFGQSYNRGWRADCDGRGLGAPVAMQGYANAWALRAPGCRSLRLRFGPEATVRHALLLSLAGGAGLLALLLVPLARAGVRRRRAAASPASQTGTATPAAGAGADRTPSPAVLPPFPDPDATLPSMSLRRALAWGAGLALVVGFVFALRAGVVAGPLVALVLWRGVPARWLTLAGSLLLLVAVPALYVARVVADGRGMPFDTQYAAHRIAAHWVGVSAYVLLTLALVRLLAAGWEHPRPTRAGPISRARARRGARGPGRRARGARGGAP